MKDPDEALVARAKKGDKKACSQLINNYYEMVYVICYGVLREREAARDVTQDVFLKLFKDIRKFTGSSKFKTWFYRVATNAAIDQYRRRKPGVSLDATDTTAEDRAPVILPETSPGPRENAGQSELKAAFREALSRLSPDQRAVLILREWQGLSYEEIADSLEIELGTVMSRLHYARRKLADVLRNMGVQI